MGIALLSRHIEVGEYLQHVSRTVYRGAPLYFGRECTNRYDAPDKTYGVLYLGFDLPTALMESVFHKHHWDKDAQRTIALSEVNSRLVRSIGVFSELCLADLTAPGTMASVFGLNLEQLVRRDYTHTQHVSASVQAMLDDDGTPRFDGVLYPSRNNFPAHSIALFDRAKAKIAVIEDLDLPEHKDWPQFVDDYAIGIGPDPGNAERDES